VPASTSASGRVASDVVPDAAIEIDAAGETVRVSNPERVLFPATKRTAPVTKLQVVEYYLAVAPGIMRALRERPTTLERWPKGVHPGMVISTREKGGGDAFFQKRIPRGAPPYVETARIQFPSGRFADEICPTEIAVVAWAAQMGTITFHPWPVRRTDVDHPDELRIDLDPQPGTDFADVRRAANEVKALLDELGIAGYPKTTGNRGLHVYVRLLPRWDSYAVRSAAVAVARELERRAPDVVTAAWWKEERGERIFVDYNQNAPHKTVFGAWGARARPGGQVSAPLRWEEVFELHPDELTLATAADRLDELGDPWEDIDDAPQSLEPLLAMHERDRANGLRDAPWPPVYPKMPDEPPRVAPSRARKSDDGG
jgi:DNA ligase D